jgi:hypothetical protein
MAKDSKVKIEFHSDAWQRFERAVGTVVKAPPQHRKAKSKPATSPKAGPRKAKK